MRAGLIRAATACGLFGLMVMGVRPIAELRAQAQSTPQQNPPVTLPAGPKDQKPTDQYSLSVEVPLVNLDVVVADEQGDPITGLKRVNFRVSEDGAAQQVSNFSTPDAAITSVLLVEFSAIGPYGIPVYAQNAIYWADAFLAQLRKDDWVALVSFDMHTRIEADFTQDKRAVHQALSRMTIPGFRESNLFDSLIETLDNLKDVKGRKSVVVLASGIDTFSKHTLDQTLKRVRETDVTVFPIGVGELLATLRESTNPFGGNLTYLQGKNQMGEFARLTGGRAYFPRFDGEIPGDMQEIAAMLRSQYSLGYTPTNQAKDGKYRKIKVDLVGDDGAPLEVRNQKGKKVKIVVYARQGYTAPKGPMS